MNEAQENLMRSILKRMEQYTEVLIKRDDPKLNMEVLRRLSAASSAISDLVYNK